MWTGFSARVRVIAYNTRIVPEADAPKSVLDLADPKWKGQVAMADPRFGSTSFHVAALYVALGNQKADDFFHRLRANGVKIVSGNSVVRDMVVKGEVKVGLTDTDDVNVAVQHGAPIAMVMPDKDDMGVPVMPNLVSMIAGAQHPAQARQMIDYLLSPDVEAMLAKSEAVQIPLRPSVPGPRESSAHRHVQTDDRRLLSGRRPGRGRHQASSDDLGPVGAPCATMPTAR